MVSSTHTFLLGPLETVVHPGTRRTEDKWCPATWVGSNFSSKHNLSEELQQIMNLWKNQHLDSVLGAECQPFNTFALRFRHSTDPLKLLLSIKRSRICKKPTRLFFEGTKRAFNTALCYFRKLVPRYEPELSKLASFSIQKMSSWNSKGHGIDFSSSNVFLTKTFLGTAAFKYFKKFTRTDFIQTSVQGVTKYVRDIYKNRHDEECSYTKIWYQVYFFLSYEQFQSTKLIDSIFY